MKNEPNIGDYVALKKPYVGRYPIGIVREIETRNLGQFSNKIYDGVSIVYIVDIPTDDPKSSRCDDIPVWRQANQLKKSSYKQYVNQAILRLLEL